MDILEPGDRVEDDVFDVGKDHAFQPSGPGDAAL
jgi:hypothetical protein